MTLAELRTLVLSWLDDPLAGYYTPAQVNVFLNNNQRTVQKRLIKAKQNHYVRCVQTTLVVNQADYVLPEDFKDLNRLELITSGLPPNETKSPLGPITLNQQDMIPSMTGTPMAYVFKKNRLVLYPAPDVAYPLRLFYTYSVTDMVNDSDVPDVPEDYHELIALLAAQDGFLKDGRSSDLLNKKLKEFQEQMDQDLQERSMDQPRGIVQTGYSAGTEFYW